MKQIIKILSAWLLSVALVICPIDTATAAHRGSTVPVATSGCPFPATAAVDGCADAQIAGGVGKPGLYTFSNTLGASLWVVGPTTGQSWAGSRPARDTWNVGCEDYGCGPWDTDPNLVRASTMTATQATNQMANGISGICGAYSSSTNYVRCNTDLWSGTGHVNPANTNQWLIDANVTGTLGVGQHLNFACNPAQGAYCGTIPNITATCAAVGGLTCFVFDGPGITDLNAQGTGTYPPCGYPTGPAGAANFNCYGTITLNVNKVYFDDAGLFITGHADMNFFNVHITIGKKYCTVYGNGNTIISLGAGLHIEAWNWLGDQDANCAGDANMYKQANDPGLPTLGTFTGDITNGKLTIAGCTGSCHISFNQFLDWSGRTSGKQYQICATGTNTTCYGGAGGNPSGCDDAGCAGIQFLVTEGPCSRTVTSGAQQGFCPGPNNPALNVSAGTTFTAGPIMNSIPYFTNGGGFWTSVHSYRFLSLGTYMMQADGSTGINIEYGACRIIGWVAVHASCFVNNGTPGSATTRPYYHGHYVTSFYGKTARYGTGTANITFFTTSGTANNGSGTGFQMTTSEYKLDHSILFSNVGGNNGGYAPSPSGGPVNALSSILNQGTGTYPGIVGDVIWDSNLFSKVGADAECRLDANVVVTGSIVSTNNWDLDTNLAVSCPDLN